MPLDGVFYAGDYDPNRFGVGATPRVPDGGVELARVNAIQEQWLRNLEVDGAPVGWGMLGIPEDEGYDVYLGETIASMSRYNTSPINPLDDAYQFNKGVTGGGSPPTRGTPDIAILAVDPEEPGVRKVAPEYEGYPVGTYLAAKSIVGRDKKTHTRLTPFVEFTITASAGVGKALEWQAAQDLPQASFGEGLWLSAPVPEGGDPDPSTVRLQAIRPKGGRTYVTRGPLKLGSHARKPPKFNETKVGKPKKLRWGDDIRIRGGLGHDLQPMRLKVGIVEVTPQGESVLSDLTDAITIKKERKGHGLMFHPKHLHPDATGFKIFAQVDDVDNPPWYQLIRTEKGDKFRRFALVNRPVLFGYIDTGSGGTNIPRMPNLPDEDKDNDQKKKKRNERENRHFWLLAPADPPSEDSSGMEDPTGEIDPPIPTGLGRPGPGSWYVSYSRRFNGKPTQASRPVAVTIGTNEVIEIQFPPRVNKITNALYGQLNQKGVPLSWTFLKQDGTVYADKDAQMEVLPGRVYIRTSGAPTATDRHPRASSWDATDLSTLAATVKGADKERLERIRCTLEVREYASGRAFAEVVQFDANHTEIGAISLGTLTQNGFLYIDKTVAGDALNADVVLDPSTAFIGIRWGIENGGSGSRNLKVGLYNLFWHPFDAHPRRFEPRGQPNELWIPSIDPAVPIPGSHVAAIGPPPPTAGDVQSAPTPLNTVDHSTGSVAVGSGSLPSGFVRFESNPGPNSETTIATAPSAFIGASSQAAKFRSDGLLANNINIFQKNYSSGWPGGNSIAMRMLLYIERLPSGSGGSARHEYERGVSIAAISTSGISWMALLRLTANGSLYLQTYNTGDFIRSALIQSNLRNGDTLDVELLVGGGGTTSGIASTFVGVNGSARSPGAYISGIDWSTNVTKNPRTIQYGGFNEEAKDMSWTFWYDNVSITQNGYAGTVAPPVTGPTPMPDRPQNGAGNYRDTASDGETINQGYAFYLRSDVLEGVWMGHETDEFYVKPGVQRTAAVFMKPQDFPEFQRIFVLAAYNAEGDRVELGCLSEQTGANAVANLTPGWFEYWMTYTPPDGYFRLRWEHEGTTGGTYVWQEPVDAVGNLSTLALRDAARVEARATTATFSILLEARVPDQEGTNMANGWLEERKGIIVSSVVPDELQNLNPAAVTWRARSSDVTDVWTAWQTEENLIPDLKYIDLEISMRGDGIHSPIVPAGGAAVLYSTYQPILLRENRTPLPGGALIGGSSDSNLPRRVNRHEYDTEAVGGRALPRALTGRIGRLGPYSVRVYTRAAEDEVADTMAVVDLGEIADVSEWFIEDWYENLYHRIRFYAPSDFEPEIDFEFVERRQEELTGLRIPRVMAIEATHVLETHYLMLEG